MRLGVIQKSGAWFSYGDTRLGQGRDNVKIYLKEHPDFMAEVESIVRANADKLLAAGKKGKVEPVTVPAPAASAKLPSDAVARAKEADLDIMVED